MAISLLWSDMSNYLFSAISCLCLLHIGVRAEECSQAVLAKSETFYVPAGGNLSLSCVIQHCGDIWTWSWMWANSTDERLRAVKESARHRLTNVTLSANQTKLTLTFPSVDKSDEGSYQCMVKWSQVETGVGNFLHVNITAAVPSQRSVLHRVLICASACLCLPIILGLACCLSSEAKPQPLPRTLSTRAAVCKDQPHPAPQPPPRHAVPQKHSTPAKKAPPKLQQKTEVVYADISQGALRQQRATREPAQSTVYSSLKFS